MSADPQPEKIVEEKGSAPVNEAALDLLPIDELPKGRWERAWPTIACGAGLFSDGYLNGVCVQRPRYTAWRSLLMPNCTLSHIDLMIARISD
jgi:hypothetical protein